jgi:hypothetical protein
VRDRLELAAYAAGHVLVSPPALAIFACLRHLTNSRILFFLFGKWSKLKILRIIQLLGDDLWNEIDLLIEFIDFSENLVHSALEVIRCCHRSYSLVPRPDANFA